LLHWLSGAAQRIKRGGVGICAVPMYGVDLIRTAETGIDIQGSVVKAFK
jgi:hypothetical protein